MEIAIKETERRRKIQDEYNKKHNITPKTIIKDIHPVVSNSLDVIEEKEKTSLSKKEREALITRLEREMNEAAKDLILKQQWNLGIYYLS